MGNKMKGGTQNEEKPWRRASLAWSHEGCLRKLEMPCPKPGIGAEAVAGLKGGTR